MLDQLPGRNGGEPVHISEVLAKTVNRLRVIQTLNGEQRLSTVKDVHADLVELAELKWCTTCQKWSAAEFHSPEGEWAEVCEGCCPECNGTLPVSGGGSHG
jgi:hypothetical protein